MTRRSSLNRRETPKLMAEDARQLMDNPVVQKVFDDLGKHFMEKIRLPHNDSPEAVAFEQELCRELRTVGNLRRGLSMLPQRQDFREKMPQVEKNDRK